MKLLSLIFAVIITRETYSAALPPSTDVCLCLGEHCFTINGVEEDDHLVTPLTDEVNIHLPLSSVFRVESMSACAARKKRDTSVDVHASDHGVGVGVDHSSGNTHVHGSVDVDRHGHVSGSGSVDHQSGNVHTSAGVSVDHQGHVSAHVGVGISFGRK